VSGIGLDGGCGGFALVVVAVPEEVWVVYCIMEAGKPVVDLALWDQAERRLS
jgi:hypothetical protein